MLQGSDLQFRREHRLDIALVLGLEVALVFLPAADIPAFVGEGRVDLGITGRDQVAEHDANAPAATSAGVEEIFDLGFGKCRLQVQVPEVGQFSDPKDLIGKSISTSFTGLTAKYFAGLEGVPLESRGEDEDELFLRRKLKTRIRHLSGSVEAACALGVADGIVDLVGKLSPSCKALRAQPLRPPLLAPFYQARSSLTSFAESGETMRAARLKSIDTVMQSSAVLIKSSTSTNSKLINLIVSRIKGVISMLDHRFCSGSFCPIERSYSR